MSKPYFETEVVKVKKEKGECIGEICIRGRRRPLYEKDHYIYFEGKEKEKKKGNWVNGENLDKIKFPCYCKFDSNKGINGSVSGQCVKGIGRIDKTWDDIAYKNEYQISIADHQTKGLSVICSTPSLKRLFEIYVPTILPTKIIIYEEE